MAAAPKTIFQEDSLCIKVYDVDTKQVIYTFSNYKLAAKGLGTQPETISRRCKSKLRLFSPILNKEVALRLVKDGPAAA